MAVRAVINSEPLFGACQRLEVGSLWPIKLIVLQNEYLIAENRILRSHLPARFRHKTKIRWHIKGIRTGGYFGSRSSTDGNTKSLGEIVAFTMGQSPPSATYNELGEGLPF